MSTYSPFGTMMFNGNLTSYTTLKIYVVYWECWFTFWHCRFFVINVLDTSKCYRDWHTHSSHDFCYEMFLNSKYKVDKFYTKGNQRHMYGLGQGPKKLF